VFFTDTSFFPGMEKMDWDMVSIPKYKEMPNYGTQAYPNYICTSNTSKEKEASMKVLDYLTSEEFQTKLSRAGTVSSLSTESVKKALGAEFPKKVNWRAVYYSPFAPSPAKGSYENLAEKALSNRIPAIVTGEMDVNTALRTAQDEADKAIKAAAAK